MHATSRQNRTLSVRKNRIPPFLRKAARDHLRLSGGIDRPAGPGQSTSRRPTGSARSPSRRCSSTASRFRVWTIWSPGVLGTGTTPGSWPMSSISARPRSVLSCAGPCLRGVPRRSKNSCGRGGSGMTFRRIAVAPGTKGDARSRPRLQNQWVGLVADIVGRGHRIVAVNVVPERALFAGPAIYDCGPLHLRFSFYYRNTEPRLTAPPTHPSPCTQPPETALLRPKNPTRHTKLERSPT